jgi:hypothetical protein
MAFEIRGQRESDMLPACSHEGVIAFIRFQVADRDAGCFVCSGKIIAVEVAVVSVIYHDELRREKAIIRRVVQLIQLEDVPPIFKVITDADKPAAIGWTHPGKFN